MTVTLPKPEATSVIEDLIVRAVLEFDDREMREVSSDYSRRRWEYVLASLCRTAPRAASL